MEARIEAFDSKLREIQQDKFTQVAEELPGALIIIGFELTRLELPTLMTVMGAEKGFDAFRVKKSTKAAREVAAPPQCRVGGKPVASQWIYYNADWGGLSWNSNAVWGS